MAVADLDGRLLAASAGADAAVGVADLAAGRVVGRRLTGHVGAVCAVATTALDGSPVAVSGSADGTIRLWDLAAVAG